MQSKVVLFREYGSGKIGATNVLRTAGRKAAAMVLVGDVLKGAFIRNISRTGFR